MSRRILRFCNLLLIVGWISSTVIPVARATDSPLLTGSYSVQNQADSGGQVQVMLQIHLQNRGVRDLHIQHMTLWDLSHPAKGATQACSITVRAGSSSSTTQKFTVPRAEYELWKMGSRPRIVLEIRTTNGHPSTAVVRLEHSGKAPQP